MAGAHSSERVARPLELKGLLERGAEHSALVQAVNALPGGRGRVIAVVGPPGVGKTSIGAMARSLGADAGVTVLRARGAELEQRFAYGVVRQLFERLVIRATPAERADLFSAAAAGAQPALGTLPAIGLPQRTETRFQLLHGLFWFLVQVADRGPLLAVVDDLHWVDPGSLAFIDYLARRVEELPVLLVLTARDAEEGEYRRLLAELAADPAVTVLRPGPLSQAAVARLVRERLGSEAPAKLCNACHTVTSGNPLFLRQLLFALEGEEPSVDAVERVAGRAVKDLVRHRIASLGGAAVTLAQAVAVLGGRAPLPVAAELAGLAEADAALAADALVRGGFFEADLSFVHPIVRAAVYDELAPGERRLIHARAANALLRRGAPDEQVASHILAAPEHTGDGWLEVLLRAADEARRRASLETAAVHLRRALGEPGAERGELLRMLGLCEGYSQDLRRGEAHLRGALELADDAVAYGRCSLSLGRVLNVVGETAAAAGAFAAGLDRMGDEDPELALTLQADLVGGARLSSSLAEVWRERSAAFRAATPDGPFRAMATAYAAIDAAYTLGARDEVVALAERALSGPLSPNRPPFYMAVYALLMCERFEAAHRHLTEALRLAHARGNLVTDPVVYCNRSSAARARGALAAARADAELGLDVSEPSNFARRLLYATLLHCLIEEGALDQAEAVLAATELDGPLPDAAMCDDLLAARGRLRLARGDAVAALDDLLLVGRRERVWGPRGMLAPRYWAADAALAHAALGDREAALALSGEQLAVARELGAPGALGVALRTEGVLRGDVSLLEEAVLSLRASEARLELARGLLELGTALPRKDGREHLRDARALAAECAAPALVAAAEARLSEGGGRLPRLQVSGVQALTAQERRVAELAASDMTNRQIAQELYLTEKTVETHLSSVYRKLAIKSRRQLALQLAAG
ncbi:AAA family ATPase [Solirubrobacter ginsenosidimutans]|uniref:AAA family ATPase n=1 Tax=Solirubrobacter ginsenosidimutans TaxID=490573 RepID=A0A9X3MNB0_9ACTN|nr:LuxR family transcriptional regulator [Solirubrobacter ginsenosidimutans]MDA0158887.1 AAA family ATPase [Solirubrobacter ginsenosidimutans]